FVMDIYKALGREVDKDIIAQIPLHVQKVPQQKNGEECGIFVLYFIHLFMRDASKSECSEGYPDFLTGAWFNREEVDKFDEEVRLFLARNNDNVTSEVELPDMKEEEMEEEQKPVKIASSRMRGYTTCHHVYAMEEGRRICVAWNDIGQPRVKGSPDLDRSDLFIKRHTRKDGKPTNEAAKHVIEKLKSLKSAQPLSDDSTPHQVAARNDTYTQVLGPDRPGRVSGVGTGPTPTSMWGMSPKNL
ncbi:hypothetical protein Taro_004864, partial [Colocasia esculenta]|nr:hypothetical protein [Colocasia esculenta]